MLAAALAFSETDAERVGAIHTYLAATKDASAAAVVKELVKEEIMGAEDGMALLKMYSEGSPVINGALDVYDLDSEMGELVDTLSKAVRSVEAM